MLSGKTPDRSRFQFRASEPLGPLRLGFYPCPWISRTDLHQTSESRRDGGGTEDRAGTYQSLPARIHVQIQAFQRTRSEQLEIASFGKNNFVHGLRLIHRQYGIANRTRDNLPVRQLKLEILLAPLEADRVQDGSVNPRGFGARVDPEPPNGCRFGSHRIEDPATDIKQSHLPAIITRAAAMPDRSAPLFGRDRDFHSAIRFGEPRLADPPRAHSTSRSPRVAK